MICHTNSNSISSPSIAIHTASEKNNVISSPFAVFQWSENKVWGPQANFHQPLSMRISQTHQNTLTGGQFSHWTGHRGVVCGLRRSYLVSNSDQIFSFGHHGVSYLALSQVLLRILQHIIQALQLLFVGLLHFTQQVTVQLPLQVLTQTLIIRGHVWSREKQKIV